MTGLIHAQHLLSSTQQVGSGDAGTGKPLATPPSVSLHLKVRIRQSSMGKPALKCPFCADVGVSRMVRLLPSSLFY